MRIAALNSLWKYHELLFSWTLRTIQARYQQTILGGLWAVLQPAASATIFTIIFTLFMPVDTGDIPYVVFSYSAMVPWVLFSSAITDMVECLVTNMNLVTKIYFPREILPLAALLARLMDYVIAFIVLLLVMIYFSMPVFTSSWLYLPIILLTQLTLMLGLGLAGSALNVFFRDIRHVITLGMQLWFFATPIIYPITLVPERLRPIYSLNPMTGIIQAYRLVLLQQQAPSSYFLTSVLIAVLALVAGYWFFKRVEFKFADVI